MPRFAFALAALLPAALGACVDQAAGGGAGSREEIKAVGSSTVYPFTTIAAEQYLANTPGARAPVIESTGTGAGMKLFCAGVGAAYPDIADASRRMKASEYRTCAANGVQSVLEIQIGIDGVAFAEPKNGPSFSLTLTDLYRAVAATPGGKPNTARTWRDVNPTLPAVPIQVYGPPATSGTRDALAELVLAPGCKASDPDVAAIEAHDKHAYEARCLRVREDGSYIDAGENDNLIVQKLAANPNALGIFGYGYLEENAATVTGVPLNGVAPTYETIASGRYPGARPLFLYVKKAHLTAIPGLRAFLAQYTKLWAPDGPLVRRGLIAAPDAIRARSAAIVRGEMALDPTVLD